MEASDIKAEKIVSLEQFRADFLARLVGNKSQTQVSEEYDISKSTLNGWIKGKKDRPTMMPPAYKILEIAKGDFDEAAWLVYGVKPMPHRRAASSSADEPESEQRKYQPMHLPADELEAFLGWLLGQVETMKAELPLTRACRAVATRLADDNAPEARAKTSGESASAKDDAGKDSPSEEARRPPPSHSDEDA